MVFHLKNVFFNILSSLLSICMLQLELETNFVDCIVNIKMCLFSLYIMLSSMVCLQQKSKVFTMIIQCVSEMVTYLPYKMA